MLESLVVCAIDPCLVQFCAKAVNELLVRSGINQLVYIYSPLSVRWDGAFLSLLHEVCIDPVDVSQVSLGCHHLRFRQTKCQGLFILIATCYTLRMVECFSML